MDATRVKGKGPRGQRINIKIYIKQMSKTTELPELHTTRGLAGVSRFFLIVGLVPVKGIERAFSVKGQIDKRTRSRLSDEMLYYL